MCPSPADAASQSSGKENSPATLRGVAPRRPEAVKEWGQDLAGSNVSCGFCRVTRSEPHFSEPRSGGGPPSSNGRLADRLSHLDDRFADVELFAPEQLLNILRCYRMYEVGRKADGTPLEVPPYLAGAENAFFDEDQPSSASN